jgi:hypothetical protein
LWVPFPVRASRDGIAKRRVLFNACTGTGQLQ